MLVVSIVGVHTICFEWSKFVQRYNIFFVYARFFWYKKIFFLVVDFFTLRLVISYIYSIFIVCCSIGEGKERVFVK